MNHPKNPIHATLMRFGTVVGYMGILMGAFFLISGSLQHPFVWLYGGLGILNVFILAGLLWHSPGLMQERVKIGPNSKKWDQVLVRIQGILTLLALILSGLDFRFGWLPPVPVVWRWFGVALVMLGNGLIAWSMRANQFFSTHVRIQTDRGHHVIDTGPYRIIRHPGYTGIILTLVGLQFMLGSWLGFVFILMVVGVIGYRTHREENTLIEELEGYQAFTERTRYRLLPGIW